MNKVAVLPVYSGNLVLKKLIPPMKNLIQTCIMPYFKCLAALSLRVLLLLFLSRVTCFTTESYPTS